jgi:hypothetical protein
VGSVFHHWLCGGVGRGPACEIGHAGGGELTAVVLLQVAHDDAGVVLGVFVAQAAGQMRGGGATGDARGAFQGAECGSAAAGLINVALQHEFAPEGAHKFWRLCLWWSRCVRPGKGLACGVKAAEHVPGPGARADGIEGLREALLLGEHAHASRGGLQDDAVG